MTWESDLVLDRHVRDRPIVSGLVMTFSGRSNGTNQFEKSLVKLDVFGFNHNLLLWRVEIKEGTLKQASSTYLEFTVLLLPANTRHHSRQRLGIFTLSGNATKTTTTVYWSSVLIVFSALKRWSLPEK